MPSNLPHFTRCASPGVAHEFSKPGALLTFIALGVIGYFALAAAGAGLANLCAAVAAAALAIIAVLDSFEYWFYNERLMCIHPNQCAVGTVAGEPFDACDGDRKVDILIAPYGYREVERELIEAGAIALHAANAAFPAPPPDFVTSRAARLAYVYSTLGNSQRRQLYLEVVHHQMFAPDPARAFQDHYYVRERPVMGDPAFFAAPPDELTATDPNPMFRYEREPVPGAGFIGTVFCDWLLSAPEEPGEERIVPYMHCEIEGNRLQRGIENLKLSILAFAGTFVAVCIWCGASFLCGLLAAAAGFLIAFLVWLLSKLFNDPDDGEAGEISVDVPEGTDVDGRAKDEVGDVVLLLGDWIMDTEHDQYFEIHPVKAWYRLAKDPRGDPRHDDDGTGPPHGGGQGQGHGHGHDRELDVRDITAQMLGEMCKVASTAEASDPLQVAKYNTTEALSMVAGFVR